VSRSRACRLRRRTSCLPGRARSHRRLRAPNKLSFEAGVLPRCGWSEPDGERVREPRVGVVSHPGDMSVGPDEHGGGSRDRADNRKLPNADVFGADQLNPIRPRSDVETAGLAEVE
jgi:hypothetical protein